MKIYKKASFGAVGVLALTSIAAYDNTLTGLIPSLYNGLDVVSRELVGFIPSVNRDANTDRAAVGQSVTVPIAPVGAATDIAPAMTIPEPADRTMDNVQIVITKSRAVDFGYNGEEERGLNNNGSGINQFVSDNFAQALRTLTNEIETDLAVEAYLNASRAYGTPGTTPFATNLGDSAQVRKILDDNGAPFTDRSLILDTSAGASLRTLQNLTRVNEAGTTMTLRDGELLNVHGFSIKESAQIQTPAIGTAAATADVDATGYAIGSTDITLAAIGTGTILAGDYVTFAGDANEYLVTQGVADVSAGGVMKIAAPGLREAIPAVAGTAITVSAQSARNIAFSRNALQLAFRAPALPGGKDVAVDSMMMVDPRSGLVFEVRVYEGYRKVRYEVAAAWGVKAIKPEHMACLYG